MASFLQRPVSAFPYWSVSPSSLGSSSLDGGERHPLPQAALGMPGPVFSVRLALSLARLTVRRSRGGLSHQRPFLVWRVPQCGQIVSSIAEAEVIAARRSPPGLQWWHVYAIPFANPLVL